MSLLKKNGHATNALLICLILVINSSSCSKTSQVHKETIRLVDILSSEHVKKSPFKDLLSTFNLVEEKINWTALSHNQEETTRIFTFATRYQVLTGNQADYYNYMQLYQNGKLLNSPGSKADKDIIWQLKNTRETLNLIDQEGYNNEVKGLILKPGHSFKFTRVLPRGPVDISLLLANQNWRSYKRLIKVFFNKKAATIPPWPHRKHYWIKHHIQRTGQYTIEIKYKGADHPKIDEDILVIRKIHISPASDLLFYSLPAEESSAPPAGNFRLIYYTADPLPGQKQTTNLKTSQYLFEYKKKYAQNYLGPSQNPFSIIHRVSSNGTSYKVLACPPQSEFCFPLKIPPGSILQTGFGFYYTSPRILNRDVHFQIILQTDKNNIILFDQTLNTQKNLRLKTSQINLSQYSGINAKILFRTEAGPHFGLGKFMPIWENPLLFQPLKQQINHVILISIDTLRPDHLGCLGYHRNTCPNIDILSSDGVIFTKTYSTTSWTLPAHVSLLTALDCANHGVYQPTQKMNPSLKTLAQLLSRNNYYSAAITGGGYLSSLYGFARGFDSYYTLLEQQDIDVRLDEAERLSQKVVKWLESNHDKRFFLFLHTYQPHDPYANQSAAGQTFIKKNAPFKQINMNSLFQQGNRFNTSMSTAERHNIVDLYDGEIKYTDEYFIKPIIKKLKDLNLYKQTMIVLTSDHGEEFFEHKAWLHDHSLYDEGIKIPLIIKFPNLRFKGRVVNQITRITDIMPTIMETLHIQYDEKALDGQSLLPMINRKETSKRSFKADLALRETKHTHPDLITSNKEQLKFIWNREILSPYILGVSQKYRGKFIELYDLGSDPQEKKNIALYSNQTHNLNQLLKQLDEYLAKFLNKQKHSETVKMDDTLKQQLKTLGYIN